MRPTYVLFKLFYHLSLSLSVLLIHMLKTGQKYRILLARLHIYAISRWVRRRSFSLHDHIKLVTFMPNQPLKIEVKMVGVAYAWYWQVLKHEKKKDHDINVFFMSMSVNLEEYRFGFGLIKVLFGWQLEMRYICTKYVWWWQGPKRIANKVQNLGQGK